MSGDDELKKVYLFEVLLGWQVSMYFCLFWREIRVQEMVSFELDFWTHELDLYILLDRYVTI